MVLVLLFCVLHFRCLPHRCIVSATSSGIDSSGDMDNDSNKIKCDFVNSNTSFVMFTHVPDYCLVQLTIYCSQVLSGTFSSGASSFQISETSYGTVGI